MQPGDLSTRPTYNTFLQTSSRSADEPHRAGRGASTPWVDSQLLPGAEAVISGGLAGVLAHRCPRRTPMAAWRSCSPGVHQCPPPAPPLTAAGRSFFSACFPQGREVCWGCATNWVQGREAGNGQWGPSQCGAPRAHALSDPAALACWPQPSKPLGALLSHTQHGIHRVSRLFASGSSGSCSETGCIAALGVHCVLYPFPSPLYVMFAHEATCRARGL
jgi:hypothetical protein